ncbi:phosphoenolpyruvate synthase [Streptomyces humidus]|uniref:Phosphoenolpyruvate synthase n=1 Tax=Streptomyces humidus TaxID=52259 RepID=A0A918L8P4_9ACTN|nr:PEP/pyruvate-binding domain-containing protein [Streptomyces humidus]GGS19254.1 phosphoenolpyruvate synthase [Streptomyces humidus]
MSSRYAVSLESAAEEPAADLVGGKCAGLLALVGAGQPVPRAFAVTVDAFRALFTDPALRESVGAALAGLDPADLARTETVSSEIRRLVSGHPVPSEIEEDISAAYRALCAALGRPDAPVAVRSSATSEDLAQTSFAGQYDTCLWIQGAEAVLDAVRHCWSSLWTTRALTYRAAHGVSDEELGMAVCVQEMVDARTAGVAMTLNPVNGDRSKIVIEAGWGLGEPVLSGEVTPDHYLVDKVLLVPVRTVVGAKFHEMVPAPGGQGLLRRPVDDARRATPCLSTEEVVEIARVAKQAERSCGAPQEIEWALARGLPASSGLRLLQSRAETVWSRRSGPAAEVTAASGAAGIAKALTGM